MSFKITVEWFIKVAMPPFAPNVTVLWSKSGDGREFKENAT
jgi:hypothetical protein